MRLLVARCEVAYSGRLSTVLPEAVRLLMIKADGSVMVHADAGGYKPLKSMLYPLFRHLNEILVRWAMRKYKRLRRHPGRARRFWLTSLDLTLACSLTAVRCAPRWLDDGSPVS